MEIPKNDQFSVCAAAKAMQSWHLEIFGATTNCRCLTHCYSDICYIRYKYKTLFFHGFWSDIWLILLRSVCRVEDYTEKRCCIFITGFVSAYPMNHNTTSTCAREPSIRDRIIVIFDFVTIFRVIYRLIGNSNLVFCYITVS